MATIPKVTVEVAFDGGPFSSSYTWTDISDWVEGFKVRRGRNNELDRIEAGTLSLTLDNSDGRFTPGKEKAGKSVLTPSPVSFILDGRADITSVYFRTVGSVGDDQKVRFTSQKIWTNGKSVSCYFAIKWKNAGGSTLRYNTGTRFLADGSPAVYTHEEAPPAGVASAEVWIWADTYPEGNTGVTLYADEQAWYQTQPYWPNVLPHRRVRVRTSNLTPKDVSTGGDITRTSGQFLTSQTTGTISAWANVPKSGAGSVRVDFGANGAADYASSVYCGFSSGGKPVGLAKVVPGQTYSAQAQVRLGTTSPALTVKQRIRWYDVSGNFLAASPDSAATALVTDQWVPVANTGVVAPANAVWAGVWIGSSGGDGPNGYLYVDEVQLEQGPTLSEWNPGGSIFHGYIEKWPVTTGGLTASVEVSAVDGFSILSNASLRAAMQAQILTTNPLGYWTLGDSVGSTRLENLSSDQQPATLVASKYGGATALLGATSIVAKDATTCYSLANISATTGTVVDICDDGARSYPLGTDFSVAWWCQATRPSAGSWVTLFAGWSDTAADFMSVRMDSNGKLEIKTTYTEGTTTTLNSTAALSSSAPSFVVVTVEQGITRLYINGVFQQSDAGPTPANKDIRDLRWASLAGRQAGSIYEEYSNGRHAHLAIWDRRVLSTELDPIWRLGDNGGVGFTEDERVRLGRIVSMANFQGDTAYDTGKSTLQGPEWSTGASALDELQATADDASGYVFMDGDGRLTYHNRQRRQSAVVRYELSDSLGLPYEPGLTFEMDIDRIVNEVAYKRPGGIESVVKDSDSIEAYGRKSKSVELRVTTDTAVQDAAYTLLNVYAEPSVRCDSVTLNASATPALFLPVLGVEIGDRITLSDLPTAAPDSSADYYVEAIDTAVQADGGALTWETTLSLSPAANSDVWLLEDATLGRLDRTAVLAY